MAPITSPDINKLLRRYLRPILQDHGFQHIEPRKALRWHDHAIWVFELHALGNYFSGVTGWPSMSITGWTGMYYDFIPPDMAKIAIDKKGRLAPREWLCHLRGDIRPTIDQTGYRSKAASEQERKRNDIWWIEPDGKNLIPAIENLCLCFAEQAIPWFERWEDFRTAFEEIEKENPCLMKHWRAVHFARQLGETEKAKEYERLYEPERVEHEVWLAQIQGRRKKRP